MVIKSTSNAIVLLISAIPQAISRTSEDGIYRMGAAPATLQWKGLKLKGRVIYEFLHRINYNRLAGQTQGLFRNFNGLYLKTDTDSDFYFHSREGKGSSLSGKQLGFATWEGTKEISDVEFNITKHKQAFGLFQWPVAWSGRFKYNGEAYRFNFETVDRKWIKSWIIGGFSMSIVKGKITSLDGSKRFTVIGLGELII